MTKQELEEYADKDLSKELPLSYYLQATKEGRHLMMQITFPIADHFNTHPEKIPIELVVQIVEAVKECLRTNYKQLPTLRNQD